MKLLDYIKEKKVFLLITAGIILGLLLVFSDNPKSDNNNTESYSEFINSYTNSIEKRLAELVDDIDGASNAKVMITLKCGSETVYASDGPQDNSKHVIVDNNLVYVKEYLPQIEGVAVVCKGGNDPKINNLITQMLCSLLGLYSTHVFVTE